MKKIDNPANEPQPVKPEPFRRGKRQNSSAKKLVEVGDEISAPAHMQEKVYAAVIGKTILAVEKISSAATPSQSEVAQAQELAREENLSLLEAAFSGKGIAVRSKG